MAEISYQKASCIYEGAGTLAVDSLDRSTSREHCLRNPALPPISSERMYLRGSEMPALPGGRSIDR